MSDVTRLPGPLADHWDWQMLSACRGAEPTLFFHPEGERGQARARRERAAKQICATCPVIAECRAHALTVREPYGVWGGLGEGERAELLARRDAAARQAATQVPQQRPATTPQRRPAVVPQPI
jgi:WhiB family redox-sensing transcriptional regulator